MSGFRISTIVFCILGFIVALNPVQLGTRKAMAQGNELNTLTAEEKAEGWYILFDGESFIGWTGVGRTEVPADIWKIENGAIQKIAREDYPLAPDGEPVRGGNLRTKDTFQNFEISLEWKVAPRTNSGIKYNVFPDRPGSFGSLGFEYQVLDDAKYQNLGVLHKAGALYELYPPNNKKHLRPAGEYNHTRIIMNGTHGEHWLNGEKIVEYEIDSRKIRRAFAKSKWSDNDEFLDRRVAPIVFQDHGGAVWFRNIKIKPPPSD
ncbi:MAG TPA: DUF1080 domain-containing protein [bacterium]|nr:DUF1080 domain-containing protein [bacterium]